MSQGPFDVDLITFLAFDIFIPSVLGGRTG